MAKEMSNDFKVAMRIYECNLSGEPIWYRKLADEFEKEGTMDRMMVSRNIDKLFDLGIAEGDWEKIDGTWTRTYRITESMIPFMRGLKQGWERSPHRNTNPSPRNPFALILQSYPNDDATAKYGCHHPYAMHSIITVSIHAYEHSREKKYNIKAKA